MKKLSLLSVAALMAMLVGCREADSPSFTLHWSLGAPDPANGMSRQVYTLTNNSGAELGEGWTLYFTQLPYKFPPQAEAPLRISEVCSTYYKIEPAAQYVPVAQGGSVALTVSSYYNVFKDCQAPEGAYVVMADGSVKTVAMTADPMPLPADGERYYSINESAPRGAVPEVTDIVPSVKSMITGEGSLTINRNISLVYPGECASEASMLGDELTSAFGAKMDAKDATAVSLVLDGAMPEIGDEGYLLSVSRDGINITANTAAGIFYGTRTMLSMLKGSKLPATLPCMEICDYPDFAYRGQMIDVVRTYASREQMMELIDLFAYYKMNTLHFHFSDDEGWRIEIPGLPELTTIGATRGHTLDESDMLFPAYDGGPDSDKGYGSGYLSREEFIGLLKYADARHVKIIPEIESPGHARAAVKAMAARYEKYKDTDMERALEYLLHDFDDTSVYSSAQYYTDNVMCVALPSVYRFMEKVVDELAAMYREAGVTLDRLHIGGDEVAEGAWTGSPICAGFMRTEGIASFDALAEYYILRVNEMLAPRGIRIGGWQELVDGRSHEFREAVKDNIYGVYCWHTIGSGATLPYRLANLGYKVILSNATNHYLDFAYNPHPQEPGHWWGGFVDMRKSYSTVPYNIYASVRFDDNNNLVDVANAGEGLDTLVLTDNVIGLQGQLWGEVIRGAAMRQYQLFPKILGLAERSWNARPEWAGRSQSDFDNSFASFDRLVAEKEIPWLAGRGVCFHIPQPGIKVTGGLLYANSPIDGAEIRYTLDGTDPTGRSALWTEPVECGSGEVRARLFWQGRSSVSSCWRATE